jgi:glutamate synthase (NADPH/NADH) large chain
LIVEAGDVREVHHVALLIGYGAAAVNPYLAIESVEDLGAATGLHHVDAGEGGRQRHQGARQGRAQGHEQDGRLDRGVLHRAQIFEALGLSREVVDRYFTGTTSKLGGVTLDQIAEEVARGT